MDMASVRMREAQRRLGAVGFDPGDSWKLTERTLTAVREALRPHNVQAGMNAAVTEGDVEQAVRLARASVVDAGRAAENIEAAEIAALRTTYPWTDGYTFARTRYADAVAKLEAVIKSVDVDADAVEVMDLREDRRKAWKDAPALAAAVAEAYLLLNAVAQVAIPRFSPEQTSHALGLAVEVWSTPAIRRAIEVWEAQPTRPGSQTFTTSTKAPVVIGRTGRFGELVKMGHRLAAPALEDFSPIEVPQLVRGPGGSAIDPLIDPKGAAEAQARIDAMSRRLGAQDSHNAAVERLARAMR